MVVQDRSQCSLRPITLVPMLLYDGKWAINVAVNLP